MQLLYAMESDKDLTFDKCKKRYWNMIDKSYDLFLFNIFNLIQITKVAIDDEQKKKSKHLPTEEDKAFTAKFCENELIESLRDNAALNKIFEKKGFSASSDRDHFKKIYYEFAKEPAYIEYLKQESTNESHTNVLLELYRFCRRSELFNEIINDAYLNWIDDKSLAIGSVKKVIKALPVEGINFLNVYYPDDQTVKEFGEELLERTHEGENALLKLIKPVLKNWDHERLAVIDMILLKMATSEMLEFPTIPTKVTLNEYVEIAKLYSTDKSKEFVNGVLDKLMKQLEEGGKINKKGRGLVD